MRFQDALDAIIGSDPENDWLFDGSFRPPDGDLRTVRFFVNDLNLRLELSIRMFDPKTGEERSSILNPPDDWFQACEGYYGVTRFMGVTLDKRFDLNPDAPEGSKARVVGESTPFVPRLRCRPQSCGGATMAYLDYKVACIFNSARQLDDFIRDKGLEIEAPLTGSECLADIQERRRLANEHSRQRLEQQRLAPAEPLPLRRAKRYWFPGAGK